MWRDAAKRLIVETARMQFQGGTMFAPDPLEISAFLSKKVYDNQGIQWQKSLDF